MKKTGMEIATAAGSDNCSIAIEDFQVHGTAAKVRVKVVASAETSKQDLLTALNSKFQGKLRAVPKSFKLSEESSANPQAVVLRAVGFVIPNVEVVEASADNMGQLKEVASNMFLDDTDCIWNQTGGFLYKKNDVESADALNSLLAECSAEGSKATRISKRQEFGQVAGIQSGDFVQYMNRGEMACGFVVASDTQNQAYMVLAQNEQEPEVVTAFDVVDRIVVDEAQVKYPPETEMSASVDIQALLSYYKRMYQYNPAYFEMLSSRIRSYSFM